MEAFGRLWWEVQCETGHWREEGGQATALCGRGGFDELGNHVFLEDVVELAVVGIVVEPVNITASAYSFMSRDGAF